jgi:luciferase family oxidoreductase group 1
MTKAPGSAAEDMTLGALDLCKRRNGVGAREAVDQTLSLAEVCEAAGYCRFWLAEHHVRDSSAPAPETVLGALSQRTSRIRLGFGGVVLSYYSPYRVAEIGLSLQALAGPRIDLGLCRGPGLTDVRIASALVSDNDWELSPGAYERKLYQVAARLKDQALGALDIYPDDAPAPDLWVLGSSPHSAALGAALGANFATPLFIVQDRARAAETIARFAQDQAPGGHRRTAAAVSLIAASSRGLAQRRHQATLDAGTSSSNLIGSFAEVAGQLLDLRGQLKVDELLLVSFALTLEERLETYSEIAAAVRTRGDGLTGRRRASEDALAAD